MELALASVPSANSRLPAACRCRTRPERSHGRGHGQRGCGADRLQGVWGLETAPLQGRTVNVFFDVSAIRLLKSIPVCPAEKLAVGTGSLVQTSALWATVKGGRKGPQTHLSAHGAALGAGSSPLQGNSPAPSQQDTRDQGCGFIHSPDHRLQRPDVYTGMCTQVHACTYKNTQYVHKHGCAHMYTHAHPDEHTVRAHTCKHTWHTHTHAHRYTHAHPDKHTVHAHTCKHAVHTYTCTPLHPCAHTR